jgi:hypothetical protein
MGIDGFVVKINAAPGDLPEQTRAPEPKRGRELAPGTEPSSGREPTGFFVLDC